MFGSYISTNLVVNHFVATGKDFALLLRLSTSAHVMILKQEPLDLKDMASMRTYECIIYKYNIIYIYYM